MEIVAVTKVHSIKQTSEKICRIPGMNRAAPKITATSSGQPKFRFKLSVDVLRQASSGPMPVKNMSSNPMGMFTLLKNGVPTLIREPEIHSENTGNKVPESTAIQETSKIKLLNKKLDSRETTESSWFSLLR